MYCTQCGTEIVPKTRFCFECGFQIKEDLLKRFHWETETTNMKKESLPPEHPQNKEEVFFNSVTNVPPQENQIEPILKSSSILEQPQKRFDPQTGKPLQMEPTPTITPAQPVMRFDPMTGKPLHMASATPSQPVKRFDPLTGKPLF